MTRPFLTDVVENGTLFRDRMTGRLYRSAGQPGPDGLRLLPVPDTVAGSPPSAPPIRIWGRDLGTRFVKEEASR